jgi:hypothetical protein
MDGVSSVPNPNIERQQGEGYPHSETYHENLSGCLAWLPVTKVTGPFTTSKDTTGKGNIKRESNVTLFMDTHHHRFIR